MEFFSSSRERRLWLWTLAVVLAIYSTLFFAQKLSGILREYGVLDVSFIFGTLLIGASIVVHALSTSRNGASGAIILGVVATYLLVFVRMVSTEERTHIIEYGVVGTLIYAALSERSRNRPRVWAPPLLAILFTTALGLLDEGIQNLLPNRVYDPRDVLFNAFAGTLAVCASVALRWAKKKPKSRRQMIK